MVVETRESRNNNSILNNSPFLGLEIEKKGRYIDGIKIYTGAFDPNNIPHPVISVKQPETVKVEKDQDGKDARVTVTSKDGVEATVTLTGNRDDYLQHNFVEKVAYSIFENRGYRHGDDWSDWLTAESLVRKAEEQFV